VTILEKIHIMPVDEMTNKLVKIITCKRCFCRELCQEIRASHGAYEKAPCAVTIKRFLESEATDEAN